MLVNKTYKFCIYPNKEQEILIAKVMHGQQHPIWYGRAGSVGSTTGTVEYY
nr:helix-turn-helix domain-containing protein [Bacillus mycoides]